VFVDWILVAVTLTMVRVPRSQPPQEILTVGVLKLMLILMMMDLALHQHKEDIINCDLVTHYQQDENIGTTIMQLAQVVANKHPPVNFE